MQTLEQIVYEAINKSYFIGFEVSSDIERVRKFPEETLDKLAKLREDTILQLEEYIEHEIDVVLGMSN